MAETQHAIILGLVEDIIREVDDVGMVHRYLRLARDERGFLDLFKVTVGDVPQVRGWLITVASRRPRRGQTMTIYREHRVRLFGYMGLDDARATEVEFQELVEAIMNRVDTHQRLGDNRTTTPAVVDAGPSENPVLTHITISGVLCHYAEIDIPTLVQYSVELTN